MMVDIRGTKLELNSLQPSGTDSADQLQQLLDQASAQEVSDGRICAAVAAESLRRGDPESALLWALRVVDAPDDFLAWQSAAGLLEQIPVEIFSRTERRARVVVLGSYTTTQFVPMLRLAARRFGMAIEIHEGGYNQYEQEILDDSSRTYAFEPDFVILAVHHDAAGLPEYSADPQREVETAARRWTGLWQQITSERPCRVVMNTFAGPIEGIMGHLGARTPGCRASMLRQLNLELGRLAGEDVTIVDCDALASTFGKQRWFNDRYWYLSKQVVALDALPLLARHHAAVLGADMGLTRKCLVLDLDNTLWGGVVGEVGYGGITLGTGPVGEAYVAFQEAILSLRRRGVILCVCSKNNEADAREPFEKHPDCRLALDDFAVFVANWNPKSENLRSIASALDLGLDALVFADDNPAERELVRRELPEVEVLVLPTDPSGYTRALGQCLWFEPSSFTPEDRVRAEQYRTRAQSKRLETESPSLEEFHHNLEMAATIAAFDTLHLPRIVQLINKTNQFNLTTPRYTRAQVEAMMSSGSFVHLYLKLRDRFADHGLVGVLIAKQTGEMLEIDTWLMSCRVIGRTVEHTMFRALYEEAVRRGCRLIKGTWIPTPKNEPVRTLLPTLGFTSEQVAVDGETPSVWTYDLSCQGAPEAGCMSVT